MTDSMRPILVTGATGRIGRAVIAELLAALPAAVDVVAGAFRKSSSE